MKRGSGQVKNNRKTSRSPNGKSRKTHGDFSTIEKSNGGFHVPYDVTIEILTKLPVKTLARFRCVSKLWSSSLVNDAIKTRSLTQPRLLVIPHGGFLTYPYSSPSTYPLNPKKTFIFADKKGPQSLTTTYPSYMYGYVHGLILKWPGFTHLSIYNPTTGQSLLLPTIYYNIGRRRVFFGYDPVENLYKVFCLITTLDLNGYSSCRVFTLGSKQWREIKTGGYCVRSEIFTTGVCINGVVYYIGQMGDRTVFGRLDVRYERLNHVCMPEALTINKFVGLSLVNYHEKLGCIGYNPDGSGELWIMKDDRDEKQEWSKITLSISPPDDPLKPNLLHFVINFGVTRDGEIVIMPGSIGCAETLYAYFHDPKQNKTRRVEFESNWSKGKYTHNNRVWIFCAPDYMENTTSLSRREGNG